MTYTLFNEVDTEETKTKKEAADNTALILNKFSKVEINNVEAQQSKYLKIFDKMQKEETMYKNKDIHIPHHLRKEINTKIINIIDSENTQDITKEDIYNSFTGDGGLHGLNFSDYENRHDFSEAKKEIEQGQFFTPHRICQQLVTLLMPSYEDLIADLTCGIGNFFNYLPEQQNIYGTELCAKAVKVAKYLHPKANIECGDIRYYNPEIKFDIVFGNPPFNLNWKYKGDEYLSQFYYCLKSADLLKPAGLLALIVPESFLLDEFFNKGMIEKINELYNFVLQYKIPPDSFKLLGVQYFPTKAMVFQRKSEHIDNKPYKPSSFAAGGVYELHERYIKPIAEQRRKLKARFLQEVSRAEEGNNWSFTDRLNNQSVGFTFQLKKHLFEIKRHPEISEHYGKAIAYLEKYKNQQKPENMNYNEWEKKKITKNNVLYYLKRIINKQSKTEEDKIAIVKTNYGIKIKAYSEKNKRVLNKSVKTQYYPFVDLMLNYPVHISAPVDNMKPSLTHRLIKRKYKNHVLQCQNFNEFDSNLRNPEIKQYLEDFRFIGRDGKDAGFNEMQKHDLELMLHKRYGNLNWQQGSGKTPAAYAWFTYHFKTHYIRNTFVISPALAINLTWEPFLKLHKTDYVNIRSLADVYSIKSGQVVICSLNMLVKYQRFIKRYIKTQSQKVALVFDESDEITNKNAMKTKAVLNCFRRVKYKLEATGTTTRNNINELYSQLELLYNNSANMICDCPTLYIEKNVKGDGPQIINKMNIKYINKPFPAYWGAGLFKYCFSPTKTTVFGIERNNQDIYNKEQLKVLLKKTVITRKFKEIAGDNKYKVITDRIPQNHYEKEVYRKILEEFYVMIPKYFASTGNERKDALLRIIRQINLLIKATSTPHLLSEYDYGSNKTLPNKFNHILKKVKGLDEKVAIGCTTIDASDMYYAFLKEQLPGRKVFLIQGNIGFNQRKNIIKEFESTTNGILISTQQSLKSSVNIPTCNKVIIESLQWNIPKIEQYYFRFIRYDSKNPTDVYFITYDNTIEQNILALLMTKERINDFIKTLEFREQADVFQEYDIDMNIFNSIIKKVKDGEGKIQLRWGQQKVA